MSIHLYTKIWANMRTCYCNGVTSDPPGPAAVAGPGLGAGPGVRSGAGPDMGTGPGLGAGPGANTGPGLGAGPGANTGPGAVRPLEMQRKSRLDHQKRDFGYISSPGATATTASRAPAQRRRPYLGLRRNGGGRITAQNESAPAGHLGGGAQIALCYKAQLSKTTPRYRGS